MYPEKTTERTRWTLAGVMVLALAGCSASQSSIPSVPKPPSPPSPTPTSPSPEPADAQAPTPSRPEAPDVAGRGAGEEPEGAPADGGGSASESKDAEAAEGEGAEGGSTSSGTKTAEERRAALEGELASSLSEFDGIILKEQELLDGRREAAGGDDTFAGGPGAGEFDGESGNEPGDASGTPSAGGVMTGGSPDTPPEAVEDGDPSVDDGAAEITNGRIPSDVGDGSDDDIVARQLREAAMAEEDPELREKLWEEYRTYKSGTKSK